MLIVTWTAVRRDRLRAVLSVEQRTAGAQVHCVRARDMLERYLTGYSGLVVFDGEFISEAPPPLLRAASRMAIEGSAVLAPIA